MGCNFLRIVNHSKLAVLSYRQVSHLREISVCHHRHVSCCQHSSRQTLTTASSGVLLVPRCLNSFAVQQRCFSVTKPEYFLFKPDDPNIDPESRQPLTHPEKGAMVYSGPLTRALKRLKRLSFFTSSVGLGLIPFFIVSHLAWPAIAGFMAFVFATPAAIHFFFAKNYVTDIYYNDKTKVFHMAKLSLFLRRVEVKFTAEDVVVPDVAGPYATYLVKGVPVFINRTLFTSKEVYKHMVGYDKPLDLNISGPVNLDADAADTDEIKELEKKIKSKSKS